MASNIPEVLQGVKLANFARFEIACSNTYFREYAVIVCQQSEQYLKCTSNFLVLFHLFTFDLILITRFHLRLQWQHCWQFNLKFNTDDTIKSQKSVALTFFFVTKILKKKDKCVLKSTPPSTSLNIRWKHFVWITECS